MKGTSMDSWKRRSSTSSSPSLRLTPLYESSGVESVEEGEEEEEGSGEGRV